VYSLDKDTSKFFIGFARYSLTFFVFAATVWVGTPPQRKSVIVDTGSHYTAFPCVGKAFY